MMQTLQRLGTDCHVLQGRLLSFLVDAEDVMTVNALLQMQLV